jgi:hypothetical protein
MYMDVALLERKSCMAIIHLRISFWRFTCIHNLVIFHKSDIADTNINTSVVVCAAILSIRYSKVIKHDCSLADYSSATWLTGSLQIFTIIFWTNYLLSLWICILMTGSPGAAVKLLPCEHESWAQVLETASYRNVGKCCVHKTQSDRTLPRTLRKRELHVPGCPFYGYVLSSEECAL